jgi:hypothetical protein
MSGSRKFSSVKGTRTITRKASVPFGNEPEEGDWGLLLNGGFEDDLDNWTIVTGTPVIRQSSPDPYAGAKYIQGSLTSAAATVQQIIDLRDHISDFTAIDAETQQVTIRWQQNCADADRAGMGIQFYTEADGNRGYLSPVVISIAEKLVWEERTNVGIIPDLTRKLRVYMQFNRYSGTPLNAYIDNISVKLE